MNIDNIIRVLQNKADTVNNPSDKAEILSTISNLYRVQAQIEGVIKKFQFKYREDANIANLLVNVEDDLPVAG